MPDLSVTQNQLYRSIHEHYFLFWHAFIAPEIVKQKMGIRNKKILSAIRWHTTGRAKMSRFEQIIFVSDYVEPERDIRDRERLLMLACQNLDLACYHVISASNERVLSKGGTVHPYSINC